MSFAWYGISLDLDDDWAPVTLSGDRRSGYVRLSSFRSYQVQIRWDHASSAEVLPNGLDKYLRKLSKDQRQTLTKCSVTESGHGRWDYHFSGRTSARGSAIFSDVRKLAVIVEVMSPQNDSLSSVHRKVFDAMTVQTGEHYVWNVLGLRVAIPSNLNLIKSSFLAGRTTLEFAESRSPVIVADRWGLASQLLGKHEFEHWARAALGLPKATALRLDERHLQFDQTPLFGVRRAVVGVYPIENKIQAVRSRSRKAELTPDRSWLISSND